jgi:hypothetical protein
VATNADGNFRMKSTFATGFTARVMQDLIATAKDTIGDQLLVAGVLLRSGPIHEKVILWIKQARHGGIDTFGDDAMKHTDFLKEGATDYENFFTSVFRHDRGCLAWLDQQRARRSLVPATHMRQAAFSARMIFFMNLTSFSCQTHGAGVDNAHVSIIR